YPAGVERRRADREGRGRCRHLLTAEVAGPATTGRRGGCPEQSDHPPGTLGRERTLMAATTKKKPKPKKRTEPEEVDKPEPKKMRRAIRRLKHRQRGRPPYARPVVWLAGIQATAVLADVTGLGLELSGTAVLIAAGTTLVKARRRGRKPAMKRPVAASVWLLVATVVGPYGLVTLVLWVVGVIMAVPYWYELYRAASRRQGRPKTLPKSTVSGVENWWDQ